MDRLHHACLDCIYIKHSIVSFQVEPDGNCMYHALLKQMALEPRDKDFYDADMLRKQCVLACLREMQTPRREMIFREIAGMYQGKGNGGPYTAGEYLT